MMIDSTEAKIGRRDEEVGEHVVSGQWSVVSGQWSVVSDEPLAVSQVRGIVFLIVNRSIT